MKLSHCVFLCLLTATGYAQVPEITSFTPTSGYAGSTVTIQGSNFATNPANLAVYFGKARATLLSASSTTLQVSVPKAATYQPITVVSAGLVARSRLPFVLTFAPSAPISSSSFEARRTISTGQNPIAVDVADLDNDGNLDVIVANLWSNNLQVFRNLGTSQVDSLAAPITLSTLEYPGFIETADIDGDGRLDILVTCIDPTNKISIFPNSSSSGAISFGSRIDCASGKFALGMEVADLNRDGKLDVVTCSSQDAAISIFKNNSTPGSFALTSKFDITLTDGFPIWTSEADYDGDGKVDIAAELWTMSGNKIAIFRNNSSTSTLSFAGRTDYTIGDDPLALEAGDFDGDGKPDLVVTNNATRTVTIWQNMSSSGAVSFTARNELAIDRKPTWMTLCDWNGDGMLDVAVSNQDDNTVSVLMNLTTGSTLSFAPKVNVTTGSAPSCITSGDMNADGKPEFLVVNRDDNSFSVYRNIMGDLTVPLAPAALSPVNGALNLPSDVTFRWKRSLGSDSYRLQISTDADFATVVVDNASIVDTTVVVTGLAKGTKHYWRIAAQNIRGTSDWSPTNQFTVATANAIAEGAIVGIPSEAQLHQNYPNPFNPTTTIQFDLPESGFVALKVYDYLGKEVAKLVEGEMPAGRHYLRFDASGLASGIYLYRMQAEGFTDTKKLAVVK